MTQYVVQIEKDNRIEKAVFFAFSIYAFIGILLSTNLSFSHWGRISKGIQFACLGVIGIAFLFLFFRGEIVIRPIAILLFVAGIGNFLTSRHTFILVFALLFCTFPILDFKKLIKYFAFELIFALLFVMLCSKVGIIENGIAYRGEKIRYTLGFGTTTLPLSILRFATMALFYTYQEKFSLWLVLIDFCLSLVLYYYTDTRTGLLLNTFILFVIRMDKCVPLREWFSSFSKSGLFRFLHYVLPFAILLVIFYAISRYRVDPVFSVKADGRLSGRLGFTSNLIDEYGFSLFGKKLNNFDAEGNYRGSDICYTFYGLNYGVLSLVCIIYLELKSFSYALRNKDFVLCFALLLILVDGIVEPYLADYKYQLFLFSVSAERMLSPHEKVKKAIQNPLTLARRIE